MAETTNPQDAIAHGRILIGKSEKYEYLTLKMGNRHGLVAGATGTGKTVTLQLLAEGFSQAGTSVFAADIKGDLSGLAMPGESKPAWVNRARDIGISYVPDRFPVVFWDLFGEEGHPIRATISDMGPLLLASMLDLNDVQEGVLNIAFRLADEQGLLLLDLKDLRALLQHIGENAAQFRQYGNIAPATIGAIQRQLLVLENQGATQFFGEPALDIHDFIQTDKDGRGRINILSADKLMRSPRLYATFLLWLLSDLFEQMPEIGDPDHPKLVFFFDEAHLLFDRAPKTLLTAIEQVVRLIRSKGVGVYFVTQNPIDIPDNVLGQLGNRVQHALRAFTPRDQKAVKVAASTFRQNPKLNTETVITQLGVGEALVSMLDEKAMPEMVARTLIAPPAARVGPVTPQERGELIQTSPLRGKYDTAIDRESAFERLQQRVGDRQEGTQTSETTEGRQDPWGRTTQPPPASNGWLGGLGQIVGGLFSRAPGSKALSPAEIALRSAVQSAARSAGTQIAHVIVRNIFGNISK
ncbi:helicase HerA-like domain-containing protein [Beijerinckia mobilis]|uniref:helicase HerA-like domain-containing protein n=1 Tax=Beijerinckia mobilis TaxID=231434 RepID=UPI00055927DA|nr:helicase HerA-like domain-containing protein [Beijerinckia mobilis]